MCGNGRRHVTEAQSHETFFSKFYLWNLGELSLTVFILLFAFALILFTGLNFFWKRKFGLIFFESRLEVT